MHIKCAHRNIYEYLWWAFPGGRQLRYTPKRSKNKSWLCRTGRAHSCTHSALCGRGCGNNLICNLHNENETFLIASALQVEISLRWVSIELAIVVPHFWLEIFPQKTKDGKVKQNEICIFIAILPFSTLSCSCCSCYSCCFSITNWIRFYAK